MRLVITPTAEARIEHQFTEGIARFGRRTAEKTFARVDHFFQTTLLHVPGAGTFISERKLYEWYITRTHSSPSTASSTPPMSCACWRSFTMRRIGPASILMPEH